MSRCQRMLGYYIDITST